MDNQRILTLLAEEREKHPELADVIDLQRDLLEVRIGITYRAPLSAPVEDALGSRLQQGSSVLRAQEIAIDWDTFSGLFRRVCQITAQHRSDLSYQLQKLVSLIDDEPDRVRSLTTEYLATGRVAFDGAQREKSLDESEQQELLSFVLNHTCRPFLEGYGASVRSMLEQNLGTDWDRLWQRGACPICGGEPDFAFLDEESGARRLVCSRCDSQWLFPRIKCPFCSTAEPAMLSYFGSQDNQYRIYVCDNCRRYLKAIDLRQARRRTVFPVERVTTIDLDVAARQEGYH